MLSTERVPRHRPLSHPLRLAPFPRIGATRGMTSQPEHIEHIWIVTGPAGCGKTTVAQHLAKELSLPYIEGDDVSVTGAGADRVANNIASSIHRSTRPRWHQELL
jgi:DNA polymerase III delta prime subunit